MDSTGAIFSQDQNSTGNRKVNGHAASSGALEFDPGEAQRFLSRLDPDTDQFTFQTLDDNKERKDKALAKVLHGSLADHARTLQRANLAGAGIFITINETDGKGRKLENIVRVRAIWHEDDAGFKGSFSLEPSLIVESSPAKFHRYWLVEGDWPADEQGRAHFAGIMRRMVADYGSDPNACDLARVLRLPGFYHCKREPFLVRIVGGNGRRYSRDEILKALPPILEKPKAKAKDRPNSSDNAKGKRDYSRKFERELRSALEAIKEKVADYQSWFEIGLAIYRACGGEDWGDKGYRIWANWSQAFPQYYKGDEATCRAKWDNDIAKATDRGADSITVNSIFAMAQEAGWKNPSAGSGKGKDSTRIIGIALDHAEFFHAPNGKAYARIKEPGKCFTLNLETKSFKEWLDYISYKHNGQCMFGKQVRSEALEGLIAHAKHDCACRDVHLRVAHIDGTTFIDLGTDDGRVIKVNADGWDVTYSDEVRFIRSGVTMPPLCEPKRGGSVRQLCEFLNVTDEDFVLIVALLTAWLLGVGPFPILMLHGPAGSGKTFAGVLLCALVDPRKVLGSMPESIEDLGVIAGNRHLLAFDNLSVMSYKSADALCRIATGSGHESRNFYTKDELHVIDVMRPVMLNGIPEFSERNDLLERSIVIGLQPISEQTRRDPSELKEAFEKARPEILGALLDAMEAGLKRLPNVKLPGRPRMAGFANWGAAVTPFFSNIDFMDAYRANSDAAGENLLEADNIAQLLLGLLAGHRDFWAGKVKITPQELYEKLSRENKLSSAPSKEFPRNAKALSDHITKRLATILLEAERIIAKRVKSNGVRYIEFART